MLTSSAAVSGKVSQQPADDRGFHLGRGTVRFPPVIILAAIA